MKPAVSFFLCGHNGTQVVLYLRGDLGVGVTERAGSAGIVSYVAA